MLRSVKAELHNEEFVFCSVPVGTEQPNFNPVCTVREREGITLILPTHEALAARLPHTYRCRMITLRAHTTLGDVGFFVAVAARLAQSGVSVNPVAGYHHDHLFVPFDRVTEAMEVIRSFTSIEEDPI